MPEDFEREHRRVLDEAMTIFVQRSKVRGQMWLDFPPSDKLREIRERLHRMENLYQQVRFEDTTPGPEHPYDTELNVLAEDAIDLINYATFFVKQLRRGQRG
jgi:hypothetical protein